jgi:hypothetical protein
MRKLLGILACLAVALGTFLVNAPTASAATGIVSNGIGWTANPSAPPGISASSCTIGVVGTDSSGNKIAISASHCVDTASGGGTYYPDGSTVFRLTPTGTGAPIGTIAHRDTFVDYVVIKLYADADLRSNGPGARIDGIGPAWPGGVLCKDGIASGVTCGVIVGGDANRINALAAATGGDSGGPAFVNNTQIVGMTLSPITFIRFSAVLNSIAAQSNPAGKGLVVTNN